MTLCPEPRDQIMPAPVKSASNLADHESLRARPTPRNTPGLPRAPGVTDYKFLARHCVCEICFIKLETFLIKTFPRYQFAIWQSLETGHSGHQGPPPPHVELSRSWERWGLTNKITITTLPMIMKTMISVLPSKPRDITRRRGVREESAWRNLYVLNPGLDIFGFRIFYDMRLLSLPWRGERRCELDMESRAKCQPISPSQITFVFYRKFWETRLSRDRGLWSLTWIPRIQTPIHYN